MSTTFFTFNELENIAYVQTRSRAMKDNLKKLSKEMPDMCRKNWGWDDEGEEVQYEIPKSWIEIKPDDTGSVDTGNKGSVIPFPSTERGIKNKKV